MSTYPPGPWVLAAPASARAPLAPLLAARAARQDVCLLEVDLDALLANPAAHLPARAEAVLVVAPRQRGPFRTLPGLWLTDANARRVPVGFLPNVPFGLSLYAHAAARVLGRPPRFEALAILGQWEDRFLRSALRTSRWFQKHEASPRTFHWTADRVSRPDLIAGLQSGLAAALYYGHGRANGWAGYHGVRIADFPTPWPEPIGALLALCCENASRAGGRLSFAEQLVLRGVCGGALAAGRKTLHADNRQLGPAVSEAMTAQPQLTLAEAIERIDLRPDFWRHSPYRFIGDPAIPLRAAAGANERAAQVYAPAPDEPLRAWR